MSDAPARPGPRRAAASRLIQFAFILPAVLFVVVPVIVPLVVSILGSFRFGGEWSLGAYETFLAGRQYRATLFNSLIISASVTACVTLLAFPACAFFAGRGGRSGAVFLAVVGLAFAISALIRTLAWHLILARFGALDQLVMGLGLSTRPLDLLYTTAGVVLGTAQIMLPYAAAVIYAGMRRVDHDIVFAARSMGATPWQCFWQAYWPQVRRSLFNAVLLVFVLTNGVFVTPALLGGPTDAMLGNVMHSDLLYNYQNGISLASASGMVLSVLLGLIAVALLLLGGRSYQVRKDNP